MSAAAEVLSSGAPAAELRTRLQCYARYVALIADQLEALEQGDSARLRQTQEARDELERELAGGEAEDADDLDSLVRRGAEAVERRLAEERSLRSRWTSLEDDAIRVTRTVRASRPGRGRYPATGALAAQLDVRF